MRQEVLHARRDLTGLRRPVRSDLDAAKADLAALEARIAPLQSQIDRLSRQFWVTKEQAKANKYDLSASRLPAGRAG
jgi:multidrug resistance efflux pump